MSTATIRAHIIAVILAGFLCNSGSSIHSVNSSVQERKIVKIDSIDDQCEKNVCSGFRFDNRSEFAFFNLKIKVIINEGQPPTYDLVKFDTLIFENSTFANFPLHFFHELWVKSLDMRNCSVEYLFWENFVLADELKSLFLSDNKLQRIDAMTFYYAPELQFLFLDSNRIHSLFSESFKGLTELKFLDLHNNRLEELPEGVFEHCPKLQELNLGQNRLHVLKDDTFSGMRNILTLLLHQNRLQAISEYVFKEQRRMMLLDVSGNSELQTLAVNLNARYLEAANCTLRRINIYGKVNSVNLRHNRVMELYFSQPQELQSLDLHNNTLQQISSLAGATKLSSLDLGDNPDLGSLPDPWTVESLERLDLSNTGIKELPMSLLAMKNGRLRSLNISGNRIGEIDPRNFQALENLTHFLIHANDWNCFNLKMLMDLLITPNKMYYNHDAFSDDFPGEYINGIACMYRLRIPNDDAVEPQSENYIVLSNAQQNSSDSLEEVRHLRKELKSIVLFYEEKFSKAFGMITDLQKRVQAFEKLNETNWEHITITT